MSSRGLIRTLLWCWSLVAIVALAACGAGDDEVSAGDAGGGGEAPGEPGAAPFGDTGGERREFLSIEVQGRDLVEGTRISLTFIDDRIGANLGCNGLGGTYAVDGDVLVVSELSMTEMGCDPARHDQDEWFAGLLTSRPIVGFADSVVTLDAGDTVVRLQARELADPDRPLVDTEWELTGFIDGETAMSMATTERRFVRFDRETSTMIGSDGCNDVTAPFEVDDDRVRLGPVEAEEEGCADADAQQRFNAVLAEESLAWTVEADRLTLATDDGQGLTFVAAG